MIFTVGTPSNYTATTESGNALAANPNRRYALIRNLSTTTTVYLSLHSDAEVGKGIPLLPGEGLELNTANLCRGDVTAITESGTAALSILEGV